MSSENVDYVLEVASAQIPSTRQQLFLRYFTAVLIDLVVLNLFAEFWDLVTIEPFTITLITAVILQILLQLTFSIEHKVADFFNSMSGATAKVMRIFSAWLILFSSKLIILWTLEITLGDAVHFGGPWHGVVAFVVVIITILVAEELIVRLYQSLADERS